MASHEDVTCLSTICQTLQSLAVSSSLTSESEAEAIELLGLIPEVFGTDLHIGRIVQLVQQCRPMQIVSLFLPAKLAITNKLRLRALRVVTQIVTMSTSADALDRVGPRLVDAFVDCGMIPMLVHLACEHSTVQAATAAAELLFVLVMKIPSMRDVLRSSSSLPGPTSDAAVIHLARHCFEASSVDLQGYLCGILRVFSERYADVLTASGVGFVEKAVLFIHSESKEKSRRSIVLMLESLTEVISAFPSAYWTSIVEDEAVATKFVDIVDAYAFRGTSSRFSPASGVECVAACGALVAKILEIEGKTIRSHGLKLLLYPLVATQVVWKRCTSKLLTAEDLEYLRHLRTAVVSSFAADAIKSLIPAFLASFPALCNLLTPERSSSNAMTEAAVIVAAMLAKSPLVRREIQLKIAGYAAWANNLAGTIVGLLSAPATKQLLESIVLVDVYHCILNDGEQAIRVDCFEATRIAAALLHEQDRRMDQDIHDPFPLDIAAIEFYLARPAKRFTPQVADLTAQLTVAALVKATTSALSNEPAAAASGQQPQFVRPQAATPARPTGRAVSPAAGSRTPRGGVDMSQPYMQWLEGKKSQSRAAKKTPTIADAFTPPPVKSPFRPSSAARGAAKSLPQSPTPSTPRSAVRRNVDPNDATTIQHHNKSIVEVLKDSPIVADEYLSMAIMMHLPIQFGAHYNRGARAAIRKVASPHGLFVQPVHRNVQQSWTAQDVHVGELHVLFLPFHKITSGRLEQEIASVERHLQEISRLLVTTPSAQRTRRWFLHDMVNYILPKTELLLRDFLDLLLRFGAEDVVYQMGIIKLIDEGRQGGSGGGADGMFQSAVDHADLAMPRDILRFSGGAFRDVLHSGNIIYAVQQLRRHYYDDRGMVREPLPDDGTGVAQDGMPVPGGAYSTLIDIDREIMKLERRHAQDNMPGHDDELDGGVDNAAANDDVESEYGMDGSVEASPSSGVRSKGPGANDETLAAYQLLPPHLRQKLRQLTADDDDDGVRGSASLLSAGDKKQQMSDLESVYAKIDNS
jgi:hypothetical protein